MAQEWVGAQVQAPQSSEMEPELQVAPLSLYIQHCWYRGYSGDLDLCPRAEEPGQKKETEEAENKSGA